MFSCYDVIYVLMSLDVVMYLDVVIPTDVFMCSCLFDIVMSWMLGPAAHRCVMERDCGRTRADLLDPKAQSHFFCVHFARGACHLGKVLYMTTHGYDAISYLCGRIQIYFI